MSKKDKRRAKEAARKAGGAATDTVRPPLSLSGYLASSCSRPSAPADASSSRARPQVCNVCSETFTSRTKLFQHIADTGHALAEGGGGGGTVGGKASKKKGRR